MSISKHVKSLQKHLAQYGLYLVPGENVNNDSSNFKICFLNHHEMQRWKEENERGRLQEEFTPLRRDEN